MFFRKFNPDVALLAMWIVELAINRKDKQILLELYGKQSFSKVSEAAYYSFKRYYEIIQLIQKVW
jgi:hypothetical protein